MISGGADVPAVQVKTNSSQAIEYLVSNAVASVHMSVRGYIVNWGQPNAILLP
jgi:hypothetical protein